MDNNELGTNLAEVGRDCSELPNSSDAISRQAAIDAINRAVTKEAARWSVEELPSAQPEIIHCEKCQFSRYDALYGDRYCHYYSKAEIVPDEHFCGYGRERQNG